MGAALALILRHPLAALLAVALAVSLSWGVWQEHRATVARRDASAQRLALAQYRAEIAAAAASASEHARTVEAQWRASVDKAQEAHDARSKILAADAARSAAAADRLRQSLDIAARALRASGRAGNPPASQGGTAAASDPGVHAELFGQCVERVRVLAAEADRAVTAGRLCESYADGLR